MILNIFLLILIQQSNAWCLQSWRSQNQLQMPDYQNIKRLTEVETLLRNKPPLVISSEIDELKLKIQDVEKGNSFLFMGGDCAETFREHSTQNIINNYQLFMLSSLLLMNNSGKNIVKIARAAGQFSKPRSSEYEYINNTRYYSYKGDMINEEDLTKREPNPELMLKAYSQSAETLNLIRALSSSYKYSNVDINSWKIDFKDDIYKVDPMENLMSNLNNIIKLFKGLEISDNVNINTAKIYTGHEGLLLNYEESMTRLDRFTNKYYDCSSHFVWIGERTRQLDSAHVEFFRGVSNPIGIKISEKISKGELTNLIRAINPDNQSGKIVLITRMGPKLKDNLPELIKEVKNTNRKVTWVCDPMHGNGRVIDGIKTRLLCDIMKEIKDFIDVHEKCGTIAGGVHLEMTSNDVTECIGGKYIVDYTDNFLDKKYLSSCDPRLNFFQTIELIDEVSRII